MNPIWTQFQVGFVKKAGIWEGEFSFKKKSPSFKQKGGWLPQIQLKFMQNSSIFFVRLFQF